MAAGLNKVQIIGNVGRDVELRYTAAGKAVAQFTVAVSGYARQGEEATTEWFSVVVWDKQADLANQLIRKGTRLYVEGRLQTRSWEGQDGQKRQKVEVVASTFLLLDSKPQNTPDAAADDDSDLPF